MREIGGQDEFNEIFLVLIFIKKINNTPQV